MNIRLCIHQKYVILVLQWRSILVGLTGFGEGPKNPLKGTSVKPVVSASYAQSGVDAGGRHYACGFRAVFNGIKILDPAAVETGYCAGAYSPCGKRLLYDTGYEPALRCYPALRRERCVQCSLPCVNRSGKGSHASGVMALTSGRYLLESLFAKEDKNRVRPSWKAPRLS